MSDRVSGAPTLETRMDDIRAVLDAVGSRRAAFFGLSEGAALSILFAATHPDRTAALVVRSAFPRQMWHLTTRGGGARRSTRTRWNEIFNSSARATRPWVSSALVAHSTIGRRKLFSTSFGLVRVPGPSKRSTA